MKLIEAIRVSSDIWRTSMSRRTSTGHEAKDPEDKLKLLMKKVNQLTGELNRVIMSIEDLEREKKEKKKGLVSNLLGKVKK